MALRPIPILQMILVAFGIHSLRADDWLIKEVVSREVSINMGGVQSPEIKDVESREVSLFIENGPADPYHEVVSREVSVVVTTREAPPQITGIGVTASPAGDQVRLDWSSYNQWAIRDVAQFDIYWSNRPFGNISGLSPILSVPAEQIGAALTGLPTFQDHFLAVVAVDALGNADPVVQYVGAYVLSPQAISREVTVFIGDEPTPTYHQLISREVSLLISTPEPPPPTGRLFTSHTPSGDSVTLDWSAYNQWAVRDIDHFDIYFSDHSFPTVTGMSRYNYSPGESTSITLSGLPILQDHFFAVVPVDGQGNQLTDVASTGVYLLTGEIISREVSLFLGAEPSPPLREVISREISIVVPNTNTPAPVTGANNTLLVSTSRTRPRAIDLNWAGYNEVAELDVATYLVYVSDNYFNDIEGVEPFAVVANGSQQFTVDGLESAHKFYFAVVAEDVLTNLNPSVAAVSGITTPRLEMSIPDLALEGGQSLSYPLTVTEKDLLEYHLTFGLISGPIGLTVADIGMMTWSPDGSQTPSTNQVVVSVTDNGIPPVTQTATFNIVVNGDPTVPDLTFSTEGQQLTLKWSTAANPYRIEMTDQLLHPDWKPVAGVSGPLNGFFTAQIEPKVGTAFFRLTR